MKTTYLAILLFLFNGSALAQQPVHVSLIQLIANPQDFDGAFIRVEGYLHMKFEDSALYLSKDHAERILSREAIWVSYSDHVLRQPEAPEDYYYFDEKWVLLEGYFSYSETGMHGHLGLFSGQ